MMAPFLRVHARRAVLRNCSNLLSTGFPQGGPPFGTAPMDGPYGWPLRTAPTDGPYGQPLRTASTDGLYGWVPTIDALGGEIALTSYKYARIIE